MGGIPQAKSPSIPAEVSTMFSGPQTMVAMAANIKKISTHFQIGPSHRHSSAPPTIPTREILLQLRIQNTRTDTRGIRSDMKITVMLLLLYYSIIYLPMGSCTITL